MKKQILYIAMFLITIISAFAYDSSSLTQYFNMGDGNNATQIYDQVHLSAAKTNISGGGAGVFAVSGIQNSGLGTSGLQKCIIDNTTGLIDFGNTSWTINFWHNLTDGGYLFSSISPLNGACGSGSYSGPYTTGQVAFGISRQYASTNRTVISWKYQINDVGNIYTGTTFLNNTNFTKYIMITIQYHKSNASFDIFGNGVYMATVGTGLYSIPINSYMFRIGFTNTVYDELSIFSSILSASDISLLYNAGYGLNYSSTINASGSIENTTYIFDGFYHDYCDNNVACKWFNASSGYCEDYKRIGYLTVCTISPEPLFPEYACADTFDSYKNAGLENTTSSFSATCYNLSNSTFYPTTEGYNGTMAYDICIGSYLCHYYNISAIDSCPAYLNGIPNKIPCINTTGSIVANCFDTSVIYNALPTYPPGNNYTGYCSACTSNCYIENETSCTPGYNNRIQTCQSYHGCLIQISTGDCATNYNCVYGVCVYNATSITGGVTGGTGFNTTFFDDLFGTTGASVQQRAWTGILLLIILSLATVLTVWAMTASGGFAMLMGGIVASILMVIFTFVGLFPGWIMIMIIIFVAGVVMLLGRKLFYGD